MAPEDAGVAATREKGVWTNLHNQIVHADPADRWSIRPSSRAGACNEARFKRGEIDSLLLDDNGKPPDIGVTTVVMTDVTQPPRTIVSATGAPGRQGEALTVGLTVCPTHRSASAS